MRYSFAGLLLLLLSGTVFAQTTVPFTFTAGTAAKASEVNADFQALATVIDNLSSRILRLEGAITAADVVGTFALAELEVVAALGPNPFFPTNPGIQGVTQNGTTNGSVTLSGNGTFTGSAVNTISQLKMSFELVPNIANNVIPSANQTVVDQAIAAQGSATNPPVGLGGTWNLSGTVLTLNFNGTFPISFNLAAGPNLFISVKSPVGSDNNHQLLFLVRTSATLSSIAVTPTNPSIPPPPASHQQFTATGTFSDNTTKDLTASATWSSSNTAVANVSGGLANAVAPGSTKITAILGRISGFATLAVTGP